MGKRQNRRDTVPGFRGSANPEQAHWGRELRKSSAAQHHTPKPRKGSRREHRRRAINDQRGGAED